MDKIAQQLLRRRMHGLYLSRRCGDIGQLSGELLGLHCWFHRNVAFSALIRGAALTGLRSELTKTWLYRGTLHGVVMEDLPTLLALHADEGYFSWLGLGQAQLEEISEKVIRLMEDGVYSRAEMRHIFADSLDMQIIERIFSPWGGIFVYLARRGRVAFRSITSRDFDLIDAVPTQTPDEVLPECLRRFFAAYGPATLADAALFFGLSKESKKRLAEIKLDEFSRLEYEGKVYYSTGSYAGMGEIPEMTLLSGFDPLIVSYTDRGLVLPPEYKSAVILKSGICLPTIAINGRVAGLWNIKNGEPVVQFFATCPKRVESHAYELVDAIRWQTAQQL